MSVSIQAAPASRRWHSRHRGEDSRTQGNLMCKAGAVSATTRLRRAIAPRSEQMIGIGSLLSDSRGALRRHLAGPAQVLLKHAFSLTAAEQYWSRLRSCLCRRSGPAFRDRRSGRGITRPRRRDTQRQAVCLIHEQGGSRKHRGDAGGPVRSGAGTGKRAVHQGR